MKINKRHISTLIFLFLCLAFLIFSIAIYLKPAQIETYYKTEVSKASEGRIIWQKYNCHVCHQLYGLGGYLGPDLTNVYQKHKGNPEVLRHLFKGGMKQMPVFNLSEKEEDLLIAFLKSTDESGIADPRNFKKLSNGMIEQHGKQK
jgi:nitric oxide reductase subunit C